MRFRITADSDRETGVSQAVMAFANTGCEERLEAMDLGAGLDEISIVLMCRHPRHNFKRRRKLSRRHGSLQFDVMLPYERMVGSTPNERKSIISTMLLTDLVEALAHYKIGNLDEAKLLYEISTALARMAA